MKKGLQDVGIAPTYMLELKSAEEPEPSSTSSVVVESGSALTIKCVVEEGFEEVKLHKEDQPLNDVIYDAYSATLFLPSYEYSHGGLYICESTMKGNDIPHERQIRLSTKGVKPKGSPCPQEDAQICIHGTCAMQLGKPTCFCNPDYAGYNCDTLMVPDYTIMRDKAVKMVAGAGSFNIAWVLLTFIFAVLFIKQRRKLRQMESYYGPMPSPDIYGELPKNPYVMPCDCEEKTAKMPPMIKEEQNAPTPPRQSSFKKFRNAVRGRLQGTSDGRLLRQQEIA